MNFMAHQPAQGKRGFGAGLSSRVKRKKPLLVGSFYGALPDAKKHAEAAISRLRERIQKHKTLLSK
jgi:hypothetical protein